MARRVLFKDSGLGSSSNPLLGYKFVGYNGFTFSQLDSDGNIIAIGGSENGDVFNSLTTGSITVTTGASAGYILTSDSSGNAYWAPSIDIQTVVSSSVVTPTSTNDLVRILSLSEALSISNPSGTAEEFKKLSFRIKDNGTTQSISWGDKYRPFYIGQFGFPSNLELTLPSQTEENRVLYVDSTYNQSDDKWDVLGVYTQATLPAVQLSFDFTVVTNAVGGSSPNNQFIIPTFSGETYNYDIVTSEESFTGVTTSKTLSWAVPGTYSVSITGLFPRIYFNSTGDRTKIFSIDRWGDNQWKSFDNAFRGCERLRILATDFPDLSYPGGISFNRMFMLCLQLNSSNTSISSWNVSNVTNMTEMFSGTNFNKSLNNWDVSNVTNMSGMFSGCAFNQPLNNWNVSNVTLMDGMFSNTFAGSSFNQNISGWTVSNVTSMFQMFRFNTNFNQPLNTWNVSSVTNMQQMFNGSTLFNQPLNTWDVSNVTSMTQMFDAASNFNQDLGSWTVSNVVDAVFMFDGTALSATNYSNILVGWVGWNGINATRPVQSNVVFGGDVVNYTGALATDARDYLTTVKNWTIFDAGPI